MADRPGRATGPSATSTRRPSRPASADAPDGGSRGSWCRSTRARAMHWDLRLEHEGTLASWAVPKGIPPDPKRNNLAVRTEDHPLEYLDFHGEIPAGHYGAGTMRIFDRGTYEVHKWRDDEVMVTFHGERVRGKYVLFRTGGKNWMIHRMDPPEDPDREPMPERIEPMLAQPGDAARAATSWAYEIKWDGVRAIGYAEGGRLRLASRNGNDITPRYPELRELGPRARRPRGGARRRGRRASTRRAPELPAPAAAHAPDLGGAGAPARAVRAGRLHDLRPALARRPLAAGAALRGAPRGCSPSSSSPARPGRRPAHHVGDGAALLAASRAQGLEGDRGQAARLARTCPGGARAAG